MYILGLNLIVFHVFTDRRGKAGVPNDDIGGASSYPKCYGRSLKSCGMRSSLGNSIGLVSSDSHVYRLGS